MKNKRDLTDDEAFGERFDRAMLFAHDKHRHQSRKGKKVPYISHLLAVASLVIDNGGSEDEAIGALLHDVAEDQGGREALAEIDREFGRDVAAIVEGCSDTLETPKPAWRKRKEDYLGHLRTASPSVRLVAAADKLHNARDTLQDYRRLGEAVWSNFNVGREEQLWYYRSVANVLRETGANAIVEELNRVVSEMEWLARESTGFSKGDAKAS